jgi:hypothetical protein
VNPTQDFLQWAIGQGVAVAVLAFVLLRVDTRLTEIALKLQTLIDLLGKGA